MPGQTGAVRASAARASALPLQRWGALDPDFELLGELGRGGMADVYHARDRHTGADLAVKIIHARTIEDEEALARFAREARTTSRLEHPNIVSVLTTRELEDGSLALVMPYVPGVTLRDMLRRRGPLPYDQLQRILRDVATALGAAHDAGIVHRDVKPENIFVDARDGRSLLSDFGIARAIDSETAVTKTGMAIGTPAYMSPEQIDGRNVDGQSDIFSLGLVGWEMASGRRPWAGESLYSVIYKQINEELPPISQLDPDLPRNLVLAIEGALTKDRTVRWASANEFLAQLARSDGPIPGARGERVAERVRAREARVLPSAHDTAVFVRPTWSDEASSDDGAPLSDEDLALVRPRRLGRWVLAAALAAAVAVVAMAMRTPGLISALATSDVVGLVAEQQGAIVDDAANAAAPPNASDSAASVRVDSAVPDSGAATISTDSLALAPPGSPAESAAVAAGASTDSLGTAFADVALPAIVTPEPRTAPPSPPPASGASSGTPQPGPPPATPPSATTPPPSRISAMGSAARTIAAGGMHSCAVTGSGDLFCWGSNDRGQLGFGSTTRQADPSRVSGDVRFRSVSAGVSHSCALSTTGEAYCWGANDRGQLGDGSTTARPTPVAVAGGRGYRVVRLGMSHSCALTTGGEVYCWGANNVGQLGNGTTTTSARPVRALAPGRFVALDVGWNHACALADDGKVFCWGQNASGQLGDGTTNDHYAPTPVTSTTSFEAIATGGTHSCALASDGGAYCWGRNSSGQLGDGSTTDHFEPARVASQISFSTITAGSVHTCALTSGGQAYCWGRNTYGQLGDGSTETRSAPARVSGGHGFSSIDATGAHTCALTGSGESFCWGYNVEGQLGDHTRAHRSRPVYVDKPSG